MSADLREVYKRLAQRWKRKEWERCLEIPSVTDEEFMARIDQASWLSFGEIR
jgi:hypothetical protein